MSGIWLRCDDDGLAGRHHAKGWFKQEKGVLEFGTAVVLAEDRSIVALLGASPGAPTAAHIAFDVIEKCLGDRPTPDGWRPKMKEIAPTYGVDLNADACRRIRADTAPVLEIDDISA